MRLKPPRAAANSRSKSTGKLGEGRNSPNAYQPFYKLAAHKVTSFGIACVLGDITPLKSDPDRVEPIKHAGC